MSPEPELLESPERRVVRRAALGEADALTQIMRRYNQRLYRIARGIVGESDAEDVVQEAFVRAFSRIDQLDRPDRLGAWLARIAVNEALDRRRKRRPTDELDDDLDGGAAEIAVPTPEEAAARAEFARLIEGALERLPAPFRIVFILRDVEGFSVAETAACLGIPEQTVKTRLHRGRAAMQKALKTHVDAATLNVFPFAGSRCDRIVETVLVRLGHWHRTPSNPRRPT